MSRYSGAALNSQTTSFTIAAFHQAEQLSYHLGRRLHARYTRARGRATWALANPHLARQSIRHSLSITLVSPLNILILVWFLVLCWGEIWSFDNKIEQCEWPRWEKWPSEADPHHVAFIADPQLIDPHTYPGRPWPLSTFTVKHTDLYLRRAYSRIQRKLDPNTIIFLGDLFDGGREWSTPKSQSPEYIYRKYGDEFWLAEFERFNSIFLREWKHESSGGSGRRGSRRIIASLPGNHDIGFARGVRKPVRDRFVAYFGDGNRLDIIGNHTFAQVDTPSLSAAEQAAAAEYTEIWSPPNAFLDSFQAKRGVAVADHLSRLFDTPRAKKLHSHEVVEMNNPGITKQEPQEGVSAIGIPTVLLSHIPLYRQPGERCGPKRERFPDYPNFLKLEGGYQYQNVLSGQISSAIAEKLGGTMEYAFSGDDHDYCEVLHKQFSSPATGIREVTVKSISEAMGVRKPGFVLASLWNPIDANGRRIRSPETGSTSDPTLQSHLCLLPDEIGIIIKYGIFILVSVLLLLVRAIMVAFSSHSSAPATSYLLPTFSSSAEQEKNSMNGSISHQHSPAREATQPTTASMSSSADDTSAQLSARTANPIRPRSTSPLPSYWTTKQRGGYDEDDDEASYAYGRGRAQARRRPRSQIEEFFIEWLSSIWYVARVVVVWYLVLFNFW